MAENLKALEFEAPELNKKYVITAKADHEIVSPEGYRGKLTRISNEAVIEGLIRRKSNLVAARSEKK